MATAGGARGSGPERAYCAPDLPVTGRVVLDPEESAHLVRSRRVRPGETVVLFDGRNATRRGRLLEAAPRAAVVEIEGDYPDRRPARALRLAVSLPEGGRADRMVAALAELGVAEFAALQCTRTPPGRKRLVDRRAERWARLAREAAKVNGCSRLLAVGVPLQFEEAIAAGAVLLDPDPAAPALAASLGDDPSPPWILVGPEGGFTQEEVQAALTVGARTARLGDVALRTDTAAVAAAAVALAWAGSGGGRPVPLT